MCCGATGFQAHSRHIYGENEVFTRDGVRLLAPGTALEHACTVIDRVKQFAEELGIHKIALAPLHPRVTGEPMDDEDHAHAREYNRTLRLTLRDRHVHVVMLRLRKCIPGRYDSLTAFWY